MPVALTMMFQTVQQPRPVGWSETVILPYNTINDAIIGMDLGNGYRVLRCDCLGTGVINSYCRLSLALPGPPPVGPNRRVVRGLSGLPPTGTGIVRDLNLPFYFAPTRLDATARNR
jgi:hypothetical protein